MNDRMTLALLRGSFRILGSTAPWAAARFAETLFTTPRRFPAPERERDALVAAVPLRIPFENMTIRAWRWGSGPAVLLVHGWEGRASQMATFAAPLVARRTSVIAFDAPAHGRSDGKRTTLPQFAAAVRAVADAAGGPIQGVIAHSFGCAATTLALHDGLHADRLVFIAPPADAASYTRKFGTLLGLDDAIVDAMKRRIERRFQRRWSDFSVAKMAVKMTAPLLVVHDTGDDEIPLDEARAIVDGWPFSRLLVTSGLGHRRILRDESVTRACAEFLADD